jgi:HlyD family secretion protein
MTPTDESRFTASAYSVTSLNADAALKTAEAQVFQAKAAVIEAEASVEKAQRNLSYCEIVSSVDGVVIDRRVNVGQTVVSSMSASSLFLVARDLSHVQVWVAVNEADIGSIRQGGRVTFTVDTFPGRTFEGTVRRTRLNATVTSNVVTYTVEVDTDNSDLTLLPYLTANVQFETARADGALVVPAKALRVRIAEPTGASDDGLAAIGAVAGAGGGDAVYVMDGGAPRRVPVKVILSNGADAAVESVGGVALAEGVEVVTGVATVRGGAGKAGASAGGGDGTGGSPFMPKMPKPPKNRAGGGPPP